MTQKPNQNNIQGVLGVEYFMMQANGGKPINKKTYPAHTLGNIGDQTFTCILATGSGCSVANQQILAIPGVRFAAKKQITDHVIGVASFKIRFPKSTTPDKEYQVTVKVSSLHLKDEILLGMNFLNPLMKTLSWPNFIFKDGNNVPVEGDEETPKPKSDFYSVFDD